MPSIFNVIVYLHITGQYGCLKHGHQYDTRSLYQAIPFYGTQYVVKLGCGGGTVIVKHVVRRDWGTGGDSVSTSSDGLRNLAVYLYSKVYDYLLVVTEPFKL